MESKFLRAEEVAQELSVSKPYALRSELKDFRFLRKVLGSRQIDNLIAQAKEMKQQRKQNQRTRRRNTNYER